MRTEQLVDLLARSAGQAPRRVVEARIGAALIVGALASTGLTLATLGLNPGLSTMGSALLVKIAYVGALLAGAAWLADRAARPGAGLRAAATVLVAVVAVMALVAMAAWLRAPQAERPDLLFGHSWSSCLWRVAALSVPALVVSLRAVSGLAPTRLRVAGFAAGLLAGAVGALGYALFCAELSPVFVAAWYTLGILVPAAAGALVAPLVLRW
jgi:hypothetical protein